MADTTSDRLKEAAWTCLRKGGTKATTSRAIASAANANLGSITYHFGSKDQLLSEAYISAIRRLIDPALEALRVEGPDPVSRMLRAVALLQQSITDSPDDVPAFVEVLVQSRHMPLIQEGLVELFAEVRQVLSEEISIHQESEFLPDWIDPESMAALLLAVVQGVVLQSTVDASGPPQSVVVGQFTKLLVAARSPDREVADAESCRP